MKKTITFIAALAWSLCVCAQASDDEATVRPDLNVKVKVDLDTRFDFEHKIYDEGADQEGFFGRYLNLHINGQLNDQLSFSMRHRLNKYGEWKNDVFGATDWVYLNYSPNDNWTFSGGKQVVAIGGYEYDRAPINIYYASMFWNNIDCFQFGASATYHFGEGRQSITAQVCNSPYAAMGENRYAYNIMWSGGYGCFHSLWSVNFMEFGNHRFGKFVSLGSRFDLGRFYTEVDLMNRYWGEGKAFLGDFSVIVKACATFGKFDVFAKGGYEKYSAVPGSGVTVDKPYGGAGVEFFPLKGSRDLRLHAMANVTHDGSTGERITALGCGLTWRVNIFDKK